MPVENPLEDIHSPQPFIRFSIKYIVPRIAGITQLRRRSHVVSNLLQFLPKQGKNTN
jgi:hypothetical protein